jgi:hypothetical protein
VLAARREFEEQDKRAGRKFSQGKKAKTYLMGDPMLYRLSWQRVGLWLPLDDLREGKFALID